MTSDSELLLRYLDGEMSPLEARRFRARLVETPELCERLAEMERVGNLLRFWAGHTANRAPDLLEPTLSRVAAVEKRSLRFFSGALGLSLLLIALAPRSSAPEALPTQVLSSGSAHLGTQALGNAAIERLDSGAQQATVFVLGKSATPVVWLSDDIDTDAPSAPGPG